MAAKAGTCAVEKKKAKPRPKAWRNAKEDIYFYTDKIKNILNYIIILDESKHFFSLRNGGQLRPARDATTPFLYP